MADLFEEYPFARAWDEMFSAPGEIRPAYESVFAALQTLDAADLKARADIMGRTFLDQGITFALGRGGAAVPARPDSPDRHRRGMADRRDRASRSGSGRWRRSWPTSTGRAGSSPTASSPAGWSPRHRISTAR